MSGFETLTANRLQAYEFKNADGIVNHFDDDVVGTVAEVAGKQYMYGTDYQSFLRDVGVTGTRPATSLSGYSEQFLDIRRNDEQDTAINFHLPMANPLDPNQQYQLATLAAVNPHHRIIAKGNPSGGPYNYGNLSHAQRKTVAQGDFTPLIETEEIYLMRQRIEHTHQVGYSFGADTAAALARTGDVAVSSLICIEPVTGMRTLGELKSDFQRTEEALEGYVTEVGLASFEAARDDSVTSFQYVRGLARLSNIAISRGLAHGDFAGRLHDALRVQPDMEATVAWGTYSELARFDTSRRLLFEYHLRSGAEPAEILQSMDEVDESSSRVTDMKFIGERHAMANDVHLQAAIVKQALKDAN